MVGAWPPPCYPVKFQFWYIDSGLYGALSDSMGMSPGTNSTSMIVLDMKVRSITERIKLVGYQEIKKSTKRTVNFIILPSTCSIHNDFHSLFFTESASVHSTSDPLIQCS